MVDDPNLNDDFRDMLEALVDANGDFLLVGAHALAVHDAVSCGSRRPADVRHHHAARSPRSP
jgi:hypothetical protein